MARANDRTSPCERPDTKRCRRKMRMASVLLLLSLLSAALLAGCLDAAQTVGSVEASAGAAPDGAAEAAPSGTSGERDVPEATVGVASRIEGDLAGTEDASSSTRFVAGEDESGGSGFDADTVLAVNYGLQDGYERAVIDLG